MSDPSLSRSSSLATVFREDRYDVLLVLLVALLAVAPFVRTNAFAAAAIFALALASMLVTFRSSGVRVTWPLALVAGSAGLAAYALAVTASERSQWRALAAVLLALALAVGPLLILRRIFQHPTVTLQDIFAAFSVYLQTGLAFAFIYAAVDYVSPEAFLDPGVSERATDYIYFSFVTMLTLGYGDLVPATDGGRMMVIVQALIGQVLLVVLVAYLVGAIVSKANHNSN
jgi:hypothetical protein